MYYNVPINSRYLDCRTDGDLVKDKCTLDSIKDEVTQNIGRKVVLKADKGRKKIVTKEGVIQDAFADVFTVRINNEFDIERTVSYTYTDILTSTVTLLIC